MVDWYFAIIVFTVVLYLIMLAILYVLVAIVGFMHLEEAIFRWWFNR